MISFAYSKRESPSLRSTSAVEKKIHADVGAITCCAQTCNARNHKMLMDLIVTRIKGMSRLYNTLRNQRRVYTAKLIALVSQLQTLSRDNMAKSAYSSGHPGPKWRRSAVRESGLMLDSSAS